MIKIYKEIQYKMRKLWNKVKIYTGKLKIKVIWMVDFYCWISKFESVYPNFVFVSGINVLSSAHFVSLRSKTYGGRLETKDRT